MKTVFDAEFETITEQVLKVEEKIHFIEFELEHQKEEIRDYETGPSTPDTQLMRSKEISIGRLKLYNKDLPIQTNTRNGNTIKLSIL